MRTYIFMLMGLFFPVFLFAQYDAYLVYNAKGKKVDFTKVIQKVSEADVIFFGESHDNPISHWLELKLIKDLPELTDGKLVVGVEMFEADDQLIIDEYFAGYYDDSRFEQEAKLWKNYQTDYKPLLLAARETGIPFVATNIPRRYANMVSKKGFEVLEDLSDQARQWMAPLPVPYDPDLPVYRDMLEMSMGHGHVSENFPKAQAIKDATMAHFISENLKEGIPFLHLNGSYHSDHHTGIIWYLNQYRSGLTITTLTTVWQDNIYELEEENKAKADFIIVVPSDMIKTY